MFGNQTIQRLQSAAEESPVVYLSYRPVDEEAGPEKTFDLSRATISAARAVGAADMGAAL